MLNHYSYGITGDDTSDHITYEPTPEALAEMKLTPYKGLSSETIIRYLYTGREYNIETGDYYYRYRMMEAGIGRFTSKDPVSASNPYKYSDNNPISFIDSSGCWAELPTPFPMPWDIYLGPGATYSWDQFLILFGNYILFPGLFSIILRTPIWVFAPNNASTDNPNYMADINQCDKQYRDCQKCCKENYWGDEANGRCNSNCISSVSKCKENATAKYEKGSSKAPADISKIWESEGFSWNCWNNQSAGGK